MADSSEYLFKQAELAEAEAEAATLPRVRERALSAAQRWRMLADQAEVLERGRERNAWYRENEVSAKGG